MATFAQWTQRGPYYNQGSLLTDGKLLHYEAGTTTLKSVWTDRLKTTTGDQPLVSDANGLFTFFGDGVYKLVLTDANDVELYSWDNVNITDQDPSGEGTAIASASTLTLGTDGDTFHVTGTTTITQISGNQAHVTLIMDAATSLTHSSNLILQDAVDLTVAAGDVLTFMNEGSGVWRQTNYWQALVTTPTPIAQNYLYNSEPSIWQRGTTITAASVYANTDDSYIADRWIYLGEVNDVADFSRDTDAPTGSPHAMKALVATINRKFGVFQILEGTDVDILVGNRLTLSVQAKSTVGLATMRMGILGWDGTEDTVTSDVVSSWNAVDIDPSFATNWTLLTTSVNKSLTSSYQRFEVATNATLASTYNNLGVFFWVNDTDGALNDTWFLSQFQLNLGTTAQTYAPRHTMTNWGQLHRYFYKTNEVDTSPDNSSTNGAIETLSTGTASGSAQYALRFPVTMRVTPTVVLRNPDTGGTGSFDRSGTPITGNAGNLGSTGTVLTTTATTTDNASHTVHITADAEL